MGSPLYKIVLGMSYYIHSGGPGALGDGLRPFFKESTEVAVNVLTKGLRAVQNRCYTTSSKTRC